MKPQLFLSYVFTGSYVLAGLMLGTFLMFESYSNRAAPSTERHEVVLTQVNEATPASFSFMVKGDEVVLAGK